MKKLRSVIRQIKFKENRVKFESSQNDINEVEVFPKRPLGVYVPALSEDSMLHAGIFYKKQKYITHTTLAIYQSAVQVFNKNFLVLVFCAVTLGVVFLLFTPILFIQVFIAVLSIIYLVDAGFYMFLATRTFSSKLELSFSKSELRRIKERYLPVYSILCPIYKEVHILPQFIKALKNLDWPKDKLDVVILMESDDKQTIAAFNKINKANYIRSVIVPDSKPKTKPKACNYGLDFARGEYVVVYDAEDIPDPLQLKKVYLGFKKYGRKVACIQAKLNYYNTEQNLLTRFFTIEYSMWFDLILTSLYSLKTAIPLGGTSNHFRTADLKRLNAWDPFNVTEDADLGMRLFKLGYRTVVLDSVTLEEGNSRIGNWIRQRSRWIKGYMQTYLVHVRTGFSLHNKNGYHGLIFHLVMGGKLAFILINPVLWIIAILYFLLNNLVGEAIDSVYPPVVLYMAMISLIFGNALYLFFHIMACIKTEKWSLIKYVYLIPLYWILISIAGFMAFYQLIFKPFYWEKTMHGLHLKNIDAL